MLACTGSIFRHILLQMSGDVSLRLQHKTSRAHGAAAITRTQCYLHPPETSKLQVWAERICCWTLFLGMRKVCFLFLRRLGKFAASPCLSIHAADPSWSDIIFSASSNLTTSSPTRKLKRHHLFVSLIKKCFSPCFQRTSKEMS